MKTMIVLAMHGAPPKNFPRELMQAFFGLHMRMEGAPPAQRAALQAQHDELDAKMRNWPRTPENDPFHAASQMMAQRLSHATGYDVIVGFNEFCAPTLAQAMDDAVAQGAGAIIVITPMLTRGGEHAEHEIPALIEAAQARHPGISIKYAWPFEFDVIARFLTEQIERFVDKEH